MNKKLISKIAILVMMLSVLTLFTACQFSSSSIEVGGNQILGAFETVFNGLVNGVLILVKGIFGGIWEIIEGLCTLVVGLVALLWETIAGLF